MNLLFKFLKINSFKILASQISNGNSVPNSAPVAAAVALPEGLNIEELLEDIKKLKATVRKQGRRIAKLETALEEK